SKRTAPQRHEPVCMTRTLRGWRGGAMSSSGGRRKKALECGRRTKGAVCGGRRMMRIHVLAQIFALALVAAPAAAQQGTVTIPSVGPGGVATLGPAAQELGRNCVVVDIAAFVNRVHVHCVVPSGVHSGLYTRGYEPPPQPDVGIVYFAVGTASDPGL